MLKRTVLVGRAQVEGRRGEGSEGKEEEEEEEEEFFNHYKNDLKRHAP